MISKKEFDILYCEDIIFTPYECKEIIKLSEEIGEFYDSSQEKIPGVLYYKKTVKNSENTDWISDRLANYFIKKTHLYLKRTPKEFFINKYEKNCSFALHNDGYGFERIWSLVVQLGEDYDGGDVYLYIDEKIKIRKDIGNCFMFRAEIFHEVTKIIEGTRWSLVFFINRDDIQENMFKKTII